MSSSLEIFSSSMVPAGGFLVGNGVVFFLTTELDVNLHTELVEGWHCGGGMERGGGAVAVVGATEEQGGAGGAAA